MSGKNKRRRKSIGKRGWRRENGRTPRFRVLLKRIKTKHSEEE